MSRAIVFVLAAAFLPAAPSVANPRSIPSQVFPSTFGVNIHFTRGAPGEVEALANAYKVARMDFAWGDIEKVRGTYDFAAYDVLVRDLEANGVRPLLILDYGNDLYGKGPVRTVEQRKAYAAYCVASVKHFKGHKIMWEFWNEPNGSGFWGDRPDPEEYAAMVNVAAPAILKADPNATLLLGAFAGFPWDYIETIFKRGCLKWADAVSVHPYRSGFPETAGQDYQRLRRLIALYSPNRQVPVISGEWGYSTNRKTGIPELRQAQYLVRQRLYNVQSGILTSIWYDWKEDGPDPYENEHHFGSTHQDFSPKPAYNAALTMTRTLAGYRYVRMLDDGPEKYVMLLRNAKGESAMALWTLNAETTYSKMPRPKRWVGMLGEDLLLNQDPPVGPSPSYALFGKNARLDELASWSFLQPDTVVVAGVPFKTTLTVRNSGKIPRKFQMGISVSGGIAKPGSVSVAIAPGGTARIPVTVEIWRRSPDTSVTIVNKSAHDSARLRLIVANPVSASVNGPSGGSFTVTLDTPGVRRPETLTVQQTNATGKPVGRGVPVRVRPGSGSTTATVPLSVSPGETVAYGVKIKDAGGRDVSTLLPVGFRPVMPMTGSIVGQTPVGLSIHAEGKEQPGGSVSLTAARSESRGIVADVSAEFPDGWRYFVVTPEETAIPDNAVALGMWVNGDGVGDNIRIRYLDSKGQTYQPTYGPVNWKGWRWISMRLDDPSVGSWGGPQDGVIHKPIKWDSVFLLDSANARAHSSNVQFTGLTLLTR